LQPDGDFTVAKAKKLTVLIPCKDEQKNIRACIESVRPVADEILLADSGSTDGTLDVVRQLGGCRIIEREYVYSANFKNWAIPQATHPWVLIIDADERMTDKLARSIRRVLENPSPQYDAYWTSFECFFLGRRLKWSGWNTKAIRLFRRDVCRYTDRLVHADIEIDQSRVGRVSGKFLHYSIGSYKQFLTKYDRYTTWGAKTLQQQGKQATFGSLFFRPMLRFVSLYFLRGGFLDGLPGLQACMLTAYYNTFIKQGKLWELSRVGSQEDLSNPATTKEDLTHADRPDETGSQHRAA
jgi:glycosyltransferase involved in cell wall biosynthesis